MVGQMQPGRGRAGFWASAEVSRQAGHKEESEKKRRAGMQAM